MVCLGIIIDDFSWAPLFLLITTKSRRSRADVANAPVSYVVNALCEFPYFQHFCFLLYSILNSRFFIVFFCITLRVYIKLFHVIIIICCILISVQQQLITLHTSLFVSLFVLHPVIYIKSSISQKEKHLSLRKGVKWRFILKFVFRQIQEVGFSSTCYM